MGIKMENLYREQEGEVFVKKEFDRSYLLFPMKQSMQEEYSYQMITQNQIPGVVGCSIHYVEEHPYYGYEISMKKSLLQEYSDKKMKYKDLKELFFNIHSLLRKVSEFLLEKEGFLFEPEYMFTDWDSKEMEYIYLPVIEDGSKDENKYRKLADFLLDRTDHKDEHAVNVAYQFYKMSKEEFFSFEAFIGFMEKEDLMLHAQQKHREEKNMWTEEGKKIEEAVCEQEWENEKDKKITDWKIPYVLGTLGGLMTALYFFIPFFKSYTLYILLPGLSMLIVAGIFLIMAFYRKGKSRELDEEYDMQTNVTVEEYFDDMSDSETVFFDEEISLYLKWKEGHFSKEYSLVTFPVTVGKLKNSVQLYIDDASVSRLHARFTQQEDVIILQDLDSTNGTFVNGKRLAAGEEAVIRRNDEIQFGKIIVNVV